VLVNHSSHISKETMTYLTTRPGCFEYVYTPKHGSWLHLVECAFSKMARSFLRHSRASSKDELKQTHPQGKRRNECAIRCLSMETVRP
jgi:hypothetical protein